MSLPLILSFWFAVAAYVVHVLDEFLFGGQRIELARAAEKNMNSTVFLLLNLAWAVRVVR